MALLGNHAVILKSPGTFITGTTLGGERSNWNTNGQSRAMFDRDGANPAYGLPAGGQAPPSAWVLPQVGGGMGSVGNITGTGTLSASMAQGINIAGALEGTGSLTAALTMVVGLTSAMTGTGTLTASLVGIVQMASALAGTGSLSASLGALAFMASAMTGTGTLTADLRGKLWMEAAISPFTELSPENLATAVWSAVAASNNTAGTMGEKLNDAGSASNPWTEVIEGSYTAAEMLRLIAAALAGELDGAATTTITIKGIDGTTDRIVATVTSDGDRTALTLDGS